MEELTYPQRALFNVFAKELDTTDFSKIKEIITIYNPDHAYC